MCWFVMVSGYVAKNPRPPEPLTNAEVRAILAVLPPTSPTRIRNRALVVMLWRSGIRASEVLALRVSDVDLAGGTVRVLRGKGGKARTCGLDSQACEVVGEWVAVRRSLGIGRGPLYCSVRPPLGRRIADRQLREMFTRLGAEAGVEHRVHPHGMRHTMAVEMRREGVDLRLIQAQLGHSNLATTAIYLDHLFPEEAVNAARGRKWAG